MARDIMIGQYYQADSIIHRLDPRAKLFGTMAFMVSVFVADGWPGLLFMAAFLTCVIIISKVPFGRMLKGIKGILMLLLISVLFTMIFTSGEHMLWQFGIIKISVEGIRQGVMIAIRLIFLVIGSSIMTLTTTPNDLTDGMEKAFGPLKKIKVPVHDIAMMMSIAFRFIPILMEEADKIMQAQMARGADFNEGGLLKKAKGMIPLIVPLVVSAINRAFDLATAMEARCYRGGEGRTKMKPLRYARRDGWAYAICVTYLILAILLGIFLG